MKRPTVFFRVILRCALLRASKDEKRPWPILRGLLRSHLRMTSVDSIENHHALKALDEKIVGEFAERYFYRDLPFNAELDNVGA